MDNMQLYQNNLSFGSEPDNPFSSFMMGGYECCDMVNRHGQRVDLLKESGHCDLVFEDYKKLGSYNIRTVREGIRWSQVETAPYQYNWDDVDRMMIAAKKAGIQQVWDICHFGMPDDLTPLHPAFKERFVQLCRAFVKHFRTNDPDSHLIITPINEVGFFSWLGGEVGCTVPFTKGYGWETKYELTKAYIAGIIAIKAEDPRALILSTEPLIDIVPHADAVDEQLTAAAQAHEDQYQVIDMILGRACPELGGNPDLIDVIGCNFYYNNRYSQMPGDTISWLNEHNDTRFRSLNELIEEVYTRYRKPIILAETSHPKEDRALWLVHVMDECEQIAETGIPFWGVCWYPIIDRPDWDDLTYWHQSGLWDRACTADGCTEMILHEPLSDAFEAYKEAGKIITATYV